jgi:hypothetical protein
MKNILLHLFFIVIAIQAKAQVIYGVNQYTEYHKGTLPIVISVPHGGSLVPSSIPDRTCNSAVNVSDENTIELAHQIDSSFVKATGCHPHIIYCNLHRSKLDCNRNLSDGACANAEAEQAWNEFHQYIDTAQTTALNHDNQKAFYIDLHGHGNPIQRIELGYLLYDNELDFSDSVLNTPQYIGYSTIQNLVGNNINTYTHAELLRGNYALGTLLGNAGYPAVPSLQIPSPGTTSNYYSGGYNVAHHTSYVIGNAINGVQVECNYSNIRDSYAHRKSFADSLVQVMMQYLSMHQNVELQNCTSSNIEEFTNSQQMMLYPNPSNEFVTVESTLCKQSYIVEFINSTGAKVLSVCNEKNINISSLPKGIYLVKMRNDRENVLTQKLIIN